MSGWRLAYPEVLLAALGIIAWLAWLRRGRIERIAGGRRALTFRSGERILAASAVAAGWLALVLAAVAAAKPQYGVEVATARRWGVAIVHILDTSESMLALDFGKRRGDELSRIDGARMMLKQFISGRPNDLQGLMVFGDVVFTLVPLTGDYELLLQATDQVHAGMAGKSTAIGDALALGVKRVMSAPVKSKVVVLLSDGKQTSGEIEPLDAAAYAAAEGVKVYTIGIGRGGPAPFRVDGLFGSRRTMLEVDFDEATLKAIAERTGGRYFNALNVDELETAYAQIDRLEKSDFEARTSMHWQERYPPWLAAAIMFGLMSLVLQAGPLRRLPLG